MTDAENRRRRPQGLRDGAEIMHGLWAIGSLIAVFAGVCVAVTTTAAFPNHLAAPWYAIVAMVAGIAMSAGGFCSLIFCITTEN